MTYTEVLTILLRHWREVMNITGKELNLAPETFRLQHLLEANLLPKAEV